MENRVWLPAVVASTLYFGAVAEADNDFWMHLFVGRWIVETGGVPRVDQLSYTATGALWVDHEWLWQVVAFQLFSWGGSRLLYLVKVLLVCLCVASAAWSMAQLRGSRSAAVAGAGTPWTWGVALLLAIPVLARGWAMRPQLVTYAFLPALLGLLAEWERGRRSRGLVAVIGFAIWANLHGGFVLGLAVLALFAATGVWRGWREFAQRVGLLILCGTAACLNPYGVRLYLYLADELGRSHPISEWQPVALAAEHTAFFLLAVVFLATVRWLPLRPSYIWRAVLAAVVLAFAWRHQRHTPVFALCVIPLLAVQLDQVAALFRARGWSLSPTASRTVATGVAVIALVQGVLVTLGIREHGGRFVFHSQDYPVRVVQGLKAGGARGNLAVPLDWGGYVLWHLAPLVKPSLDGRFATVYPETVVADNFSFFRAEPGWRRLLSNYPTEAVLLPAGVFHPLQREPGWQRLTGDDVANLYVRADRLHAFSLANLPVDSGRTLYFP
ncbi:MAG: hypothetical protein N3C12_06020 [Candidatus Binatia bacterium]|nr:hypothetical protein [Candidatus Binatia bacterium]